MMDITTNSSINVNPDRGNRFRQCVFESSDFIMFMLQIWPARDTPHRFIDLTAKHRSENCARLIYPHGQVVSAPDRLALPGI